MKFGLIRLARAFVGVWGQLRRLNTNIEWIMEHHPYMMQIGLPPSKRDVKEAIEEKRESRPMDEEWEAGKRAVDLYRRRGGMGAPVEDDEPGADWDLFT